MIAALAAWLAKRMLGAAGPAIAVGLAAVIAGQAIAIGAFAWKARGLEADLLTSQGETLKCGQAFSDHVVADHQAEIMARESKRAEDERRQRAMQLIDQENQDEKSKLESRIAKLDIQLRTRDVRLRSEWTCPASSAPAGGSDLSVTAADPGGPDANAELRAAGASHLVRLAAECDTWIRALQRSAGVGR